MKKTKILIPVLSIAGLAAAIAPVIVMTSCGGNPQQEETIESIALTKHNGTIQSDEFKANLEGGRKYACIFSLDDTYVPDSFKIEMSGKKLTMPFTNLEIYKETNDGGYEKILDAVQCQAAAPIAYFTPDGQKKMVKGNYKIIFSLSESVEYDNENSIYITLPHN